ncbi:unnamed protein product [Triticum turgidum subsp. durum]|uniref:Uncharacterized protein n=1 Tax=Triticum turgidum subsp. durum TaxID=4567 RepID=A0A9R1QKU7_TRITD|nr:unnamed protein product [Triticum turgidum subsp. durum]
MPARREAIREVVSAHKVAILFLQETKIEDRNPSLVRDVGGHQLQDCVVLPTISTRGGAAIFWDRM